MIRCIAIDDEPLALDIIQEFCSRIDFIDLQKVFTQTNEAKKYINKFPVDLLFLDIQMPNISGINFYKSLSQDTMVIFSTAFSEYAVEGFNLCAIDYLLKPFDFNRFLQATQKANEHYKFLHQSTTKNAQHIYVRSEYNLVKIAYNEILFIETLDDYLKIHLVNKKPVLTLMSIKTIIEKLPSSEFIRVHRSFIVSLKQIEFVRNKLISIGIKQIPIGGKHEEAFFRAYTSEHFF